VIGGGVRRPALWAPSARFRSRLVRRSQWLLQLCTGSSPIRLGELPAL